jgi:alpha-ketoglutarate-dependent 2,4-dichlorophenoxyacetate dioxygenase
MYIRGGDQRTMSLTVEPLHGLFGAELMGADLTVPPSADLVEAVKNGMDAYGVLVVRDASPSDDDHIRFSRAFGPLELPPGLGRANRPRRKIRPELFDASNLDENDEIIPYGSERRKLAKGAERFHTDSSFNALPTMWSLLRGHIVPPEGGDTHFIDTRAVYDALPEEIRAKIEGLVAVHDFWAGRERAGLTGVTDAMRKTMPPVAHKLVRIMPYGRKALYIGGHATGIAGWLQDEASRLLDDLYDFSTQDRFIYVHQWRPNDIAIWDNRCTLHRATPFTSDIHKRDMRRTTLMEYGPERSADPVAA